MDMDDSRLIASFQRLITEILIEKRLGPRRPGLTDELYQTWREVDQRGLKKTPEYRNVPEANVGSRSQRSRRRGPENAAKPPVELRKRSTGRRSDGAGSSWARTHKRAQPSLPAIGGNLSLNAHNRRQLGHEMAAIRGRIWSHSAVNSRSSGADHEDVDDRGALCSAKEGAQDQGEARAR
jgi:hypothetical protein